MIYTEHEKIINHTGKWWNDNLGTDCIPRIGCMADKSILQDKPVKDSDQIKMARDPLPGRTCFYANTQMRIEILSTCQNFNTPAYLQTDIKSELS